MEGAQPAAPEDEAAEGSAAKTETQAARIRSFFPETWLWKVYLILYVYLFLSLIILPGPLSSIIGRCNLYQRDKKQPNCS